MMQIGDDGQLTLGLGEIASEIHRVWAETKAHQVGAWEGYFETGRLLSAARSRFPSDPKYGAWFAAQGFEFSSEWGRRLMRASDREPEVRELLASALGSRPPGVDAILDMLSGGAHVANNSGDHEWYTPPAIIAAAKAVMGGIDLDPASSTTANEVIGATTFYSVDQDGLALPWAGRVWMNPPYAQPAIWHFCERLSESFARGAVSEACALVNNATETAWFQRMAEVASAICYPAGRVKFWHPEKESAPLQGQAILYFGENVKAFCTEFVTFGFTVVVM